MIRLSVLLLITCLFFLDSKELIASDLPVAVGTVPSGFEFDGMVKPGEWDDIIPLDMTVQAPVHGQNPTERTEIRLAYDDKYIYLSGALYDSEPDKILDNNMIRDGLEASTEWFGMVIDSYNDKQNSLGFFTTPTGNRFDAAIGNDAQGREPMNVSWNNFWDAKVVVNELGWFAEIRVPWSSLQYQIKDGKVVMGISTWRYIARKNELHICPDIPPTLGEMGMWRPSQAKEYVFENVQQNKPLYITPYVLGGLMNNNVLNTAGTEYVAQNDRIGDVGLDMKVGISNNFIADFTINTDFAQVEADDQQVNLTRFSLFFPEKRLFFQERSGIFSFRLGSRNDLFYSRRIGIDADGNQIPIIGGARMTGRAGKWDIGLLSMQTAETDNFLSNNYSVFRVKKQVINPYSNVGFLMTYNRDTDGQYNTVFGVDSEIRVGQNEFLSMKVAQSLENGQDWSITDAGQSTYWISISKRIREGFAYAASVSRLGEDFDSNIGFLERSDYTRFGKRLSYTFWPKKEGGKIFSHGISSGGAEWWDNSTNSFNSSWNRISYEFVWQNGSALEFGGQFQFDDITEAFSLADVVDVPVGRYDYQMWRVEYSSPNNKPYNVRAEFSSGAFFDGRRASLQISPNWSISPKLNLSGTYEYNDISFDVRNQAFATHVARLRAQVTLSTKFSVASFIQYNSLDKAYLGNIRLRYNPREGNDLFIVYNTDVNADRGLENPFLPATNQQSLLVKYSYTFVL